MVKKNASVLLITQYFYPDITAAAFRMYELFKYLQNEGFHVEVITTFPHRVSTVNTENFTNIHRIKVHYTLPKNSRFKYILYYAEFPFKSTLYILKNRFFGCNYVFVSSPPIFVAFEALVLSVIFRKNLFVDIRDLWPDTIVDIGELHKNSLLYRVLKFFEIRLYKIANEVFCVSQPMKDYILKYRESATIVYNGISKKDFLDFKDKKSKPFGGGKFNIYYAGNIGTAQPLDFVIESAKELKHLGRKDLVFNVVGNGVKLKDYIQDVKTNKLDNVIFHKPLKRAELLHHLFENADVLVLPLKEGFALDKTIPSKLFDYLLLKKPILFHLSGEGEDILKRSNIGVKFELTKESFLEALSTVCLNYNKLWENAQKENFTVLAEFIREKQFVKIADALRKN